MRILIAVAMALVVSAPAQEPSPTGSVKEEDLGTILRKSKWPSHTVPVCWENPTLENADLRKISRDAAEETWDVESGIDFVGWGACQPGSKGIRILIADDHPHTKGLGKYLDGKKDGMVLNFDFRNWSEGCANRKEFCVYAIAAHEFGHAIGFSHEQNRDDAPSECKKDQQGTKGDYKVTEYDHYSIMNYCNPVWNGDGRLSELDIISVRTVYGED